MRKLRSRILLSGPRLAPDARGPRCEILSGARHVPRILRDGDETNRLRQKARFGALFLTTGNHRDMNANISLVSRRAGILALTLGGGALLAGAAGCARRPIIVQAPPATVIQSPAPAAAPTVIQTPAAPAPTGRDVIVVREAPPPPRAEAPPPPPPSAEYKWIPGYWSARDGRQEWVAGRWEMPPRASATWVAPRWEQRGDGYVFIDGHWR